MIRQRVTLVLGAGASAPYGFPLGTRLMLDVIDKLNSSSPRFDRVFSGVLNDMGFTTRMQQLFSNELRWAKQPSIDAFLQERGEEFLPLGKAAIAAALIPYEDLEGLLALEHEFSSASTNQRWYTYLLNLMGTYREFVENNLSIITFNYDRSLEYFLFHTIKHRFNLSDEKAVELLKTIPIVHIYGQLGKFDFLGQTKGRPYSTTLIEDTVRQCVDEIHLIYEPRDEGEFVKSNEAAYKVLSQTDVLVFLGFGYHEKNLERLKLAEYFTGHQVAATFYGRMDGEMQRDDQLIHKFIGRNYGNHTSRFTILEFLQNTNFLG